LDVLQAQGNLLRDAYEHLVQTAPVQDEVPQIAEWLLDNFYIVQQALRRIREDMPPGYYRRLPRLYTPPPLRGSPRVYALAQEIIQLSRGRVDIERVKWFAQAYQQEKALTMGELWALPTMLRLGILDLLTRSVTRAVQLRQDCGQQPPFCVPLPDDLPDERIVANCILGLHTLANQDWKRFFESVSLVEGVLLRDPAGCYSHMDFETRDRYRGVVEGLSFRTGRPEQEVAAGALHLAERTAKDGQRSSRAGHVGFYLLDRGRKRLEEELGFRPSWGLRARRWLQGHRTTAYLGAIALLTLTILLGLVGCAVAGQGTPAQLVVAAMLAFLPAMETAVSLINILVARVVPPRTLPKMDYSKGVPVECQTAVVIPSLITNWKEAEFLLGQLELHHLSNPDPHLHFALLGDLADAPEARMPEDENLLARVIDGIGALNEKHGRGTYNPFSFFSRERQWTPAEDCWMGWERKRGNLVEFNRLLRGSKDTSFRVQSGDLEALRHIRYVITLDADTALPRGAGRRLIATLSHPLNRAEFDTDGDVVVAGYTVLQPRVEVKPTRAIPSLFTQFFAGDAGLDLYTRAVSDIYQDLFDEGIYVGKGIYDVDAFQRSLAGRVPENSVLSHDLFEGIHGRAGLVTDIILYEDYPPDYLSYAPRLHRWARGDWQLLPWLLPRVPQAGAGKAPNVFSILDRWKILDNLRRTLRAPALLALLVAGWSWLPGSPLLWTALGLLISAVPLGFGYGAGLARRLLGRATTAVTPSVRAAAARWLLSLVFLPYEALLMLDAIVTTLVRLTITRKRLLQWTTAAHTVRVFGKRRRLALVWRRMSGAPLIALGLAALVGLTNLTSLAIAAPLLLGWLLSPQVALRISRPGAFQGTPLSPDQDQQLRCLARRTWLFFERFVGPDDHWLPPDHFQEDPLGTVAHRTSPTNIGLMLLSTLGAYDLGYVGLVDLTLRLDAALTALYEMERHRGHLLNWYDTGNLEPLKPRYVSTVDSGNLAGCLLALGQGLQVPPQEPIWRCQSWQGLVDALVVLEETIETLGGRELEMAVSRLLDCLRQIRRLVSEAEEAPQEWPELLEELSVQRWPELQQLLVDLVDAGTTFLEAPTLHDLRIWSERIHHHLTSMRKETEMLLPWLKLSKQPPDLFSQPDADAALREAWHRLRDVLVVTATLGDLPAVCGMAQESLQQLRGVLEDGVGPEIQSVGPCHGDNPQRGGGKSEEARTWCKHLAEALCDSQEAAERFLKDIQDLRGKAEDLFRATDFGFLFDAQRQVFHLGYHVDTARLDRNHYDLLASEARIASLVAIAKGDVPLSHWLHLERPLTRLDGARVLLSWNGSMFEYLMPRLLTRSGAATLLDESCRAAVEHQIAYVRGKGVPWGISESGYYRFDAHRNYQYRGFGVPGLGRKRGLAEDLVVAPYASLLALAVRPQAVMKNVSEFIGRNMLGQYGFYEAIDFTRSRLPLGREYAIVRSYMAHHQGMTLLSLINYLLGDAMIERFHADRRVQTVALLLQERVPQRVPLEEAPDQLLRATRPVQPPVEIRPWRVSPYATPPQVHVLSNGHYGTVVTGSGSGYSYYVPGGLGGQPEIALTRWRSDITLDDWGTWLYVQDPERGRLWSATHQPTASAAEQHVLFFPHKAEFRRRGDGVSLRLEVVVASDDDVEIRRVTLTNESAHRRRLLLTSYGEVVLAPQVVDRRHPAFGKLFVEGEYLPGLKAQLFHRRPRSSDEQTIYLAHLVVGASGRVEEHEADRARLLGRGRTARSPMALTGEGGGLSGTTGATLDPVMALRQEVELEGHGQTQFAYVTLVAESRQEALALARRYRNDSTVRRAFEQARAQSQMTLRQVGLNTEELRQTEQLLSLLLYPCSALRADEGTLAANRGGQSGLWPYAISGDYPILLVDIDDREGMPLVRTLLRAHRYWRERQLKIDLVILNQQDAGYAQELQDRLRRLIDRTGGDAWLNQPGGIFLLRGGQMREDEQILLRTAARVVLEGRKGSLADQLAAVDEQPTRLPMFVPKGLSPEEIEPTPSLERPVDLVFDNGLGGFRSDGREYVIYLEPGQWTPAPWVNVIANRQFGFLVSEAGSGFTWTGNSGENRLTPWYNDPVTDESGEALYLRDEETGDVWSPTPLPAGERAPYLVRHGAGYSVFQHHSHGLKQELCLFALPDAPAKVVKLRLENTWGRHRRITATFFCEWVLGTSREVTGPYIVPEFDAGSRALLARNPYNEDFGGRVAFVAASKELHGLTTDRTEFLGREGSRRRPAALTRVGLAGTVRAGVDPCAAIQLHAELAPGESKEVHFLLGQGADRQEALRLVRQYQDPAQVDAAWQAVGAFWDDVLGAVAVRTPDPAMDILLNRWLLYQTISCRLWGRSALYQSSGAFGFRDQLQDVMALSHAAPDLAREHILRAARHQFEEGDVLHWWHPPSGRGVRTRISDDLLWLPFVTAHYVDSTGDESILGEEEPFRQGKPLKAEENERYERYENTEAACDLLEHCHRAIETSSTTGRHGLPLIGSGDWNDGLNRVGIEGRGESVWLGWFLHATLTRFASLCERVGRPSMAVAYRRRAGDLRRAIEACAWDGDWYRRAYYDDGTPLGSIENRECQIDSIAQSWAVLSGGASPDRAAQAMQAVAERLLQEKERLLLLFAPPFDETPRDPGYIKGYPPGIRENGGQYTHAALWAAWAFAELGQAERAATLWRMLNPIHHTDTPQKVDRYRVEPYVVAADVYSVPPHTARGGWTWYTGSSGWMYRLGLEGILGVRREGNGLWIDPCIPQDWVDYELTYREGAAVYRIRVENPIGVNRGVKQVTLDEEILPESKVPLLDDGRWHEVRVIMG
jgi:cyclic beta-1,2-glucan synthetase